MLDEDSRRFYQERGQDVIADGPRQNWRRLAARKYREAPH